MTEENTTRLKLGALLMALTVVLASGTAVAVMSAGSAAQEGDQSTTVTAEDVEVEEIQMEDVEVNNLTFQLGEADNTREAVTDSLSQAFGDNVEGFEVESVNVGNVESATVTVEDNVVTVDAEIESITLENVEADTVTWNRSMGNAAHGMVMGGSISFDSLTVEGLSVGSISVESAQVTAPDNETTTTTTTTTTEEEETTTTTEEEETTTTTTTPTTTEETTTTTTTPTTTTTTTPTTTTTTTPTDGDGATGSATVSFENQTTDGTTVTVSAVSLSEPGYVAIHNDSLLEGNVVGSVIGVSDYLEAGNYQNVEITLFDVPGANFSESSLEGNQTLIAMPHVENSDNEMYDFVQSDGEEDGPFISDGEPVTDTATVSVDGNQTTTTTTTTTTDQNETTTTTTDGAGDSAKATVNIENQTSNGTVVTVSEVELSEDGYVAIHDESLLEGNVVGSVVGVSEYLEAGTYEDLNVTLFNVPGAEFNDTMLEEDQTLIAMPHVENSDNEIYNFVETDGGADGPFTANGTAVTDDAFVTVEQNQTEA